MPGVGIRGASLADVHLGYRSGTSTVGGRNSREVDVEQAWLTAIDQIVEARVDIVTIAGDLVHHPRISVPAIHAMIAGVGKLLVDSRRVVLVVQGNHDAARLAETGTPLDLVEQCMAATEVKLGRRRRLVAKRPCRHALGGWIETVLLPFSVGEVGTFDLGDLDLWNPRIAVVHAPLAGAGLNPHYAGPHSLQLDHMLERFHVLAAGDYHDYTDLAPDRADRIAFYSGSLERTSSNFWSEKDKGWVLWDTQDYSHELVPVPGRSVLDRRVAGGPEKVNEALAEMVSELDALDKPLARLVVEDFPRGQRTAIDGGLLSRCRQMATVWRFDLRYGGRESVVLSDRREGAATIDDEARKFFARGDDSDRLCLSALGLDGDTT